ncbi:MAG TPA: urate hydroxylase PuuD [Rhodocyclaceae bacterium]
MEFQIVDVLLRWVHFLAGIIWVGHNYATVVQRPSYRPLRREDLVEAEGDKFQSMLQREHGTFRWASVVAWSAGILMLALRGWLADALLLRGHMAVVGIGVYIGTVMMLNLWFVLWPHQKKVLGFVPAGIDERLRCSRITHLSSRTNTMLSIPLLFFMGAMQHGGFLFH